MAVPMTLEQDVHDLRERIKYLEGWKDGEAERYGRLERDVTSIKHSLDQLRGELHSELGQLRGELHGEVSQLRSELHGELGQLRGEISQLRSHMDQRLVQLDTRIDRLMWFIVATLGSVLAQMAVTLLAR